MRGSIVIPRLVPEKQKVQFVFYVADICTATLAKYDPTFKDWRMEDVDLIKKRSVEIMV